MSAIRFQCQKCKQKFEVDEDYREITENCPVCGELLTVPGNATVSPHNESPLKLSCNSLSCPKCGSEKAQKISLIYEAGTSDYSSTSVHSGFLTSADGNFSGLGTSLNSGTNQTKLAKRFTPPRKKACVAAGCGCLACIILPVLFTFIVIILLTILGVNCTYPYDEIVIFGTPCILFLLILIISIGLLRKSMKFDNEEYPILKKEWEKQFFCHKCGHVFTPTENK